MKAYKHLIVLILLIAGSSCTYVYYPTYPMVPDAKGKGFGMELNIGPSKAQLNAWYAFDSNFYMVGNAAGALSYLDRRDTSSNELYHALSGMLGLGYKVDVSDHFQFQLQVGGGICQGYYHSNVFNTIDGNLFTSSTVDVRTQSVRGYLQPTLGFKQRKGSVFYLIPRFTYESFTNVKQRESPIFKSNVLLRPKSFFITELYGLQRINAVALNIDIFFGISGSIFYRNSNDGVGGVIEGNVNNYISQPFLFGIGLSKTFK